MLSLKTLLAIKPQTLYPAHGTQISGPTASAAHIQAYIAHRQLREEQILAVLKSLAVDQAGPGGLKGRVQDFFARKKVQADKEYKEQKEFMSGKPYIVKKKTEEEKAKEKEKKAKETDDKKEGKGDRDDKQDEDDDGDEDKEDIRHLEFDSPGITLSLLTRLIYDTTSEPLIFAAQRPVLAHLEKLEQDKKVRKVTVQLPKIVDMVVGDIEAVEGWEIVGEEKE